MLPLPPFLFLLSSGGRDGGGGEGKIEKRKMVKASRFFNRCDKFFKRWVCVKTLLKVLDWFKKTKKKAKRNYSSSLFSLLVHKTLMSTT